MDRLNKPEKRKHQERLREKIRLLEIEQEADLKQLKVQFYLTYESLKPAQLIKNMIHDVFSSKEVKSDMVNSIMGLVSGFIAKKLATGKNDKSSSGMIATVIDVIVADVVSGNAEKIKAVGAVLLRKVFPKNKVTTQS
jgi:hypothetical protein